jgi:hypothetical protein
MLINFIINFLFNNFYLLKIIELYFKWCEYIIEKNILKIINHLKIQINIIGRILFNFD